MRHTDANLSPNADARPRYTGQERRASPRIETPFPAMVRSVDADNQAFEEHTVLDNLSGCGLYLRLVRRVLQGVRLFILIQLSVAPKTDGSTACVALHGIVSRIEPRSGGAFGLAVRLTHYRFLYADDPTMSREAAR